MAVILVYGSVCAAIGFWVAYLAVTSVDGKEVSDIAQPYVEGDGPKFAEAWADRLNHEIVSVNQESVSKVGVAVYINYTHGGMECEGRWFFEYGQAVDDYEEPHDCFNAYPI